MNWKLIFLLSLMGLAMGILTISVIPSDIEAMFCWPLVIIISALCIGKFAPGKYFLHGLFLGWVNCFWVTTFHIIMADTFIPNHPKEAAQFAGMLGDMDVREKMVFVGLMIGTGSGIVIGLLGWLSSMMFKRKPAARA